MIDEAPSDNQASPEEPVSLAQSEGVVRAAAVLAVGNIASRTLGLARDVVKSILFGASGALAAFEAAALVPTALFDLIIGGIVSSALVPVFSDYTNPEKRAELWSALSVVLSAATVLLIIVIGLVELFTPQVGFLVGANNFSDPALTALSLRLMRWTTLSLFFLSISSIITGVLFALKRFTLPAFTAAVFNGSIVVVALITRTIDGLVWGLLLGSMLQIVAQLPALRDAKLRWHLDWRHPALRRILRLYAPIVVGLLVDQVARAVSYNLAIATGDESLNYMRRATTLIQFPLGLVVTALSVAILPTLSQQANGRLTEFKQTLAGGIRLVSVLILPATLGLLALATPIVSLLFEYGRFTPTDTTATALVLRVYLLGLPFAAIDQMLVFASYARKDTLRPALVGVISMVVYLIVAFTLIEPLGLLSLMVADAVKHVVHTILMLWLLRVQIGGLAGLGTLPALLKATIAALIMGGATLAVVQTVGALLPLSSFFNKIGLVLIGGLTGVLVYGLLALLLNIEEIKTLPQLLLRRRTG